MYTDQHIWRAWAGFLQRWGVVDLTASLLEAAGPLSVLGAQFVYLLQPLLGPVSPAGHLDALARLLEDGQQTRDFVKYLREAPSR
jgi:hypothetical protein